jgi:isocitrate dehydrogenase
MSPTALPSTKTYSIASIPADGIGPEVVEAGIEVLKALAESLDTFKLEFTHYDWSSDTYKKTGKYIPDGGLESLKKHDAILFGAVGAPGTTPLTSFIMIAEYTYPSCQTFPTTSPSGDFVWPSANRSSSTPMSAQLEC